jgi:hypothetical protein
MKMRIALLGCLVLAWHTAMANVDCAKAPYGESIAQYGRDEFQLGIIAVAHAGHAASRPRALFRKADKAMRAACLAKFHGLHRSRYARLGVPPHALATESVGSIAAVTLAGTRPNPPETGTAALSSATASLAEPAKRPAVSGEAPASSPRTPIRYAQVTSNFPACPRRVDLKRFLVAALIDKAAWPRAEATGKRHGCIELHAGERVDRVRTDRWSGVAQVRPEGRAGTYWTDAIVIR